MRLKEILAAIDRVEREHLIANEGVARLHFALIDDPTIIHQLGFDRADVRACRKHLEDTYLVRVFAVFEWGARELWAKAFKRMTEPGMHDLLNGLASAVKFMPSPVLDDAQRVRDYRNNVVHVGEPSEGSMSLGEAAAILKTYLSEMPREW